MKNMITLRKTNSHQWLVSLLVIVVLHQPWLAQASIEEIGGGIELHYNALPSVDIPAQVMKTYGLKRSKNLGMLNVSLVSVADDPMGGPPLRKGIKGEVSCTATNLNRQQRDLEMKAVRSGDAIYHLALFPISNEDKIQFHCSIEIPEQAGDGSLEDEERNVKLDFSQSFYVE